MSMNIQLIAIGIVTLPNGKQKKLREEFEGIWQTPTEVTWEIEDCATFDEKLRKYLAWVERETYPAKTKEHIRLIRKWIKEKVNAGFNVGWDII